MSVSPAADPEPDLQPKSMDPGIESPSPVLFTLLEFDESWLFTLMKLDCLVSELKTPADEQLREKTLVFPPWLFGRENLTCFSPSELVLTSSAVTDDISEKE